MSSLPEAFWLAGESLATRVRTFLVTFSSLGYIAYLFAALVFGIYVISLWAALFDLPIVPFVGDMISPIRYSLIAWFVISLYYLMAQGVTKRWNGVVVGGISLATSVLAYGPIMLHLQSIQVPWLVSTLKLEPATKLLIAAVFGIAFLYVLVSPVIWGTYFSQDADYIVNRFLKIYPSLRGEDRLFIKKLLSDDKDNW